MSNQKQETKINITWEKFTEKEMITIGKIMLGCTEMMGGPKIKFYDCPRALTGGWALVSLGEEDDDWSGQFGYFSTGELAQDITIAMMVIKNGEYISLPHFPKFTILSGSKKSGMYYLGEWYTSPAELSNNINTIRQRRKKS